MGDRWDPVGPWRRLFYNFHVEWIIHARLYPFAVYQARKEVADEGGDVWIGSYPLLPAEDGHGITVTVRPL